MIKRILTLFFASLLVCLAAPGAKAEDTAYFAASKDHSYLGEEITVTLTVNSDADDIFDIQGNIAYNDKVLLFEESDCVTYAGGGNLTIHKFTDTGAESSCNMTFKFKTIGDGDGFIKLMNCQITDQEHNGIRSPSAETSIDVSSVLVTTTDQPGDSGQQTEKTKKTTKKTTAGQEDAQDTDTAEQTDTEQTTTEQTTTEQTTTAAKPADGEIPEGKLSSVRISTGYITPEFSYDVLEYDILVPHDCTWLDLEGTTSREGEYIWYTGDENVYDGDITRTIAVRDSQENETVYTFHIRRMSENEEQQIDKGQAVVTEAPESVSGTHTTTTRKLSVEKSEPTLKKLYVAAAAAILIFIVVIVAVLSNRSADKKRKKIKHTRKK